eukprot:CAMPEP_0113901066 /NCGR_PEP_ID=MMETSP0780_2-20120614/21037_1 /TAXON_ID=652834 /ORGANISM="Palpitomonas bilix" /LENGTH=535 /DNA_ID=CAMNT_0000893617 /DNA_START=52 /DNA_END=1659 /DNA_ORIENTATION=+ /assembly_acc=CAM_ASM_000599
MVTVLRGGALLKLNYWQWFALRFASSLLLSTTFVPDEHWQSAEVAHEYVYKYGYKTWEWTEQLRSFFYPSVFAAVMEALRWLQADTHTTIWVGMCAVQAGIAAIGDASFSYFVRSRFSSAISIPSLSFYVFNWLLNYSMPRTLFNSAECAFFLLSLRFWPLFNQKGRDTIMCGMAAALAFATRPTAAVLFLPLPLLTLIWRGVRKGGKDLFVAFISFTLTTVVTSIIDRYYYDEWTVPALNFFHFNFQSGGASLYGMHDVFWYVYNGVPTALTLATPFAVIGVVVIAVMRRGGGEGEKGEKTVLTIVLVTLAVLSAVKHKEVRFILPITPLLCIISAVGYNSVMETAKHRGVGVSYLRRFFTFFGVANIVLFLFFARAHKSGGLAVANFMAKTETYTSFLLALPCHTFPGMHRVHRQDILVTHLECTPEMREEDKREDMAFLLNFGDSVLSRPDLEECVFTYREYAVKASSVFTSLDYREVAAFPHTPFPDEGDGEGDVIVAVCKCKGDDCEREWVEQKRREEDEKTAYMQPADM